MEAAAAAHYLRKTRDNVQSPAINLDIIFRTLCDKTTKGADSYLSPPPLCTISVFCSHCNVKKSIMLQWGCAK